MKKILLLIAFLGSFLFAQTGTVTSITDGDSIKFTVEGSDTVIRARLHGIDTPESYMSLKTGWDSYYCDASTKDIMDLGKLATGQMVKSLSVGDKFSYTDFGVGKYGRRLIYINNLNDFMVKSGYAYVSGYFKDHDRTEVEETLLIKLTASLHEAEKNNAGLWSNKLFKCLQGR